MRKKSRKKDAAKKAAGVEPVAEDIQGETTLSTSYYHKYPVSTSQ